MWRIVIWPGGMNIFFYHTIEIPDDGGGGDECDDDDDANRLPPFDRWVVSERKPGHFNPCEGVEPAPSFHFKHRSGSMDSATMGG